MMATQEIPNRNDLGVLSPRVIKPRLRCNCGLFVIDNEKQTVTFWRRDIGDLDINPSFLDEKFNLVINFSDLGRFEGEVFILQPNTFVEKNLGIIYENNEKDYQIFLDSINNYIVNPEIASDIIAKSVLRRPSVPSRNRYIKKEVDENLILDLSVAEDSLEFVEDDSKSLSIEEIIAKSEYYNVDKDSEYQKAINDLEGQKIGNLVPEFLQKFFDVIHFIFTLPDVVRKYRDEKKNDSK